WRAPHGFGCVICCVSAASSAYHLQPYCAADCFVSVTCKVARSSRDSNNSSVVEDQPRRVHRGVRDCCQYGRLASRKFNVRDWIFRVRLLYLRIGPSAPCYGIINLQECSGRSGEILRRWI